MKIGADREVSSDLFSKPSGISLKTRLDLLFAYTLLPL